ncbi:large ribosomal subunit protein uL15-like [Mesoplodon densirostris]|uniref:large ribosomal subunit protein uL15-like n=1 Tax=Mesoplodon densirostris TaxID=48708 RepID=UPI0028DBC990|nr:large ribosomal subunit protein uL15-like [Mesoplodon densirostris]
MEKLLSVWMQDQHQCRVLLSLMLFQEKVKSLYEDLKKKHEEESEGTSFNSIRGQVSHGHSHGHIGKHWKHPEVQGNAGGIHRHRINFNKYHPGYVGKVGMRHYHLKKNQNFCPSVNLDKLWTFVSEETWVNAAKNKTGAAPIIYMVLSGYYKVLGKGKFPKQPVIVKPKFFSRRAEEKIKDVGGACVLVA